MAHVEEHSGPTRRDFLFVATGAAGGIATAAAVWPLINQMNPSADVQALASIQVDVSAVEVGSQLTIKGKVTDEKVRRIAAVSPAFPPDFTTNITLPVRPVGFRHRFQGKTLEIALPRKV